MPAQTNLLMDNDADAARLTTVSGPSVTPMSHLWLRHEYKLDERRAPITPAQVGALVAAGHEVTVESSPTRVFPDRAYREHHAAIVPTGTWPDAPGGAFILGIKEVLQEKITAGNLALRHRHIYFAHVFKGQSHASATMRRFALGRGTLLDLEYLVDDEGKRVATFSYSAGFAGAIAAVQIWADKQAGTPPPYVLPRHRLSRQEFINDLRERLARLGRLPTALVIGAGGRSGRGAVALFDALGIEMTRWGRTETGAGGPFPAILDYDIMCNCVFLAQPGPPFLTREMVEGPGARPRLSVVADVSNDLSYNPVFGLSTPTKFGDAAVRVGGVDVIEIENLPALTPLDSSAEFAEQLFPYLFGLIEGGPARLRTWERALLTYLQHHDIPDLALECGRELGERFQAQPEACGVDDLRTYFAALFAKNPLTPTDRLFFIDHLLAGAAEALPAAAVETLSALVAKSDLDGLYDSPRMGAHHALLEVVYDFSRGQKFQAVVAAGARDDFYDFCDASAAIIDGCPDAAEKFRRTRQSFLGQLGPQAGNPALATFLSAIETLAPCPVS